MLHRFTTQLPVMLIGFLLPAMALAQAPEGALTLPSSITVRDAGWGQIANTDELIDFLLSVVERTS